MPPDIPTLRRWLTDVLGEEPPDWEINSTSKHILEELYLTHQRQEAAAALEMEELQEARCEFQAEINRLSQILNKLGGLEEEMTPGLSGSYLNTLSERWYRCAGSPCRLQCFCEEESGVQGGESARRC